jgi:fused-like protein
MTYFLEMDDAKVVAMIISSCNLFQEDPEGKPLNHQKEKKAKLFPTNSLFQLIKKIRYEQIVWPSFLSDDLTAFLQGLLEKDCKKRLSWPQLLHHPFLKNTSFNFNIQRQATMLKSDSDSASTTGVLSPPISNMFSPPPLTETLSESQELAKEIQRQDKAKLLPGGSQTLIKVAEKYEEQKRKLKEEQLKLDKYHHQHQLTLDLMLYLN